MADVLNNDPRMTAEGAGRGGIAPVDVGRIVNGQEDGAMPPLLLTAREAAKALAISERTLWELTHRGDLPVVRIRRAVRYDPRDLRAWIDRQKVGEKV